MINRYIQIMLFLGFFTVNSINAIDVNFPLHEACKQGDVAKVEQFIAGGADVNQVDNQGWTPLHWAAMCGHNNCLKTLYGFGAKFQKTISGFTPLNLAVWRKEIETISYMILFLWKEHIVV